MYNKLEPQKTYPYCMNYMYFLSNKVSFLTEINVSTLTSQVLASTTDVSLVTSCLRILCEKLFSRGSTKTCYTFLLIRPSQACELGVFLEQTAFDWKAMRYKPILFNPQAYSTISRNQDTLHQCVFYIILYLFIVQKKKTITAPDQRPNSYCIICNANNCTSK